MKMSVKDVLRELQSKGSARNVKGMARYGIVSVKAYGVSAPAMRALAKKIGTDHALALKLWRTGVHEARVLGVLVGDPDKVTPGLMNAWVKDFDNWALCDAACSVLFDKTPYAVGKAFEWTKRKEEFVRRAGFVVMAALAVHDKKAPDNLFLRFLPVIERGSSDEQNYVRKAVNWALRQIGKRNSNLNRAALRTAQKIQRMDSSVARWIAGDAIRELESKAVQKRLAGRARSLSVKT